MIIVTIVCLMIAIAVSFERNVMLSTYRKRLARKDNIIATLIRGLPILFVENYKDPDIMKERDGSFVFHTQTRPEYDGRFIAIKWICEGKKKDDYNSLMMKYFLYLESLGLEIHPVLLGDRPYSGRVMIESYHELEEDEYSTEEEMKESVRQTRNI